ncbi:bifunctional aminoglycoside phosphotransferase/ATP-binding protein [Acidihalobacter prosperus]
METSDFDQLVEGLQNPDAYPHPVSDICILETHISVVLLTGQYAYKLKKPLDMGFLDFSTLARRKHFCQEEIRLNRRLAPDLYLDMVPVSGTPDSPVVDGSGTPIEYLVCMRQFDPEQQLDKLLSRGELTTDYIDDVIARIAAFHSHASSVDQNSSFGKPESIYAPMQQNFDQLYPLIKEPERRSQLQRLEHWSRQEFERLSPLLIKRRENGFIRECHGDMHLGNMALLDSNIAIFDGIEFNDDFRWIDVANEIAFFVMDLESRGASKLANRALNAWIELTGDYEALPIMRFYQAYRAMVRAKIASIRLGQASLSEDERQETLAAYQRYADLAEYYTTSHECGLIIMHGFSGAGKTTLSSQAVEELGMIRLRSDVERKRLYGLDPEATSQSEIDQGLYSKNMNERTYNALERYAGSVLSGGFSVIIDASFLDKKRRQQFSVFAETHKVPFLILDVQAPEEQLRRRLHSRKGDASEANTRVLDWQLSQAEPLGPGEPRLEVDGREKLPATKLRARLGL